MAKEAVVYPGSERGVCVAHGGCAGSLRGALRSEQASRLLRRVTLPDGGRETHALAPKPGRPQRYDYEYERKGMLNIFAFFEPNSGWRHLDISERRTAVDFALAMRRLVEEHYPTTEKVRVVLDNLNTHSPASLASYALASGIAIVVLLLAFGPLAEESGTPLHPWMGLFEWVIVAVWFACTIVLSLRLMRVARAVDVRR